MSKVYAVKKGFKTGIFTTWEECKGATHGYSGAIFRSFPCLEEAEGYLSGNTSKEEVIVPSDKSVSIYVDGSYSKEHRIYSYGCVIIHPLGIDYINGVGSNDKVIGMQSVAGELKGAITAVTWAIDHGFSQLHLYYDNKGIECWVTEEWKANKEGTLSYKDFMERSQKILDIVFHKVRAHSGDIHNEEADQLAAKAIEEFVLRKKQGERKRCLER